MEYIIEIVMIIFGVIFVQEGKHDGIIINQFFELLRLRRLAGEARKIKFDIAESKCWHTVDWVNWFLIGLSVSLTMFFMSGYEWKYFLMLPIIASLRILLFTPTVNKALGKGFFYIGTTGTYDKVVHKLGKWHWFIWLGVLIVNYIIIKK